MKKCKDCKKEKARELFYGVQGECKECTKKRTTKWAKDNNYEQYRQRYSLKRIFSHRYTSMKQRVDGGANRKYKVEGTSIFSKKAFIEWCYKPENFKKFNLIWNNWKENKFKRKLSPSIDRIDNNKCYTLKNIQWLTQSNNASKDSIGKTIDVKRNNKGQFIS